MPPRDDIEKWLAIEHQALAILRSAGSQWGGMGAFLQLFCLLIKPSFGSAVAYSFSDRRELLNGTRYYCVRTNWDRPYDRERFEASFRSNANLQPTVDKAIVKLSDSFAQSIVEQMQDISVPLFVKHAVQIDGIHYEFSNSHATLHWGEQVPIKWTSLAEIALAYVQHIDNLATDSD